MITIDPKHDWREFLTDVQPEAIGRYYEAFLKKKSSDGRRKSGIFYTPPPLARYLTRQSLGEYLVQCSQELTLCNAPEARRILQKVKDLRIVDPACGCGIFLVEAMRCLHRFYQKTAALLKDNDLVFPARYILTYQLYGVDIDPLALALTEWALTAMAADLDGCMPQLHPVASNLYAGDALSPTGNIPFERLTTRFQAKREQLSLGEDCLWARSDFNTMKCDESSLLVGEVSSRSPLGRMEGIHQEGRGEYNNWEEAFPEIWQSDEEGVFDFVLGNPPYVTEVRGNAELFRMLKSNSRISVRYSAKMDLCDAFLWLGWMLLKPQGQLVYVLPEYWTHRQSAVPIRKALWESGTFQLILNSGESTLFSDAPGHHSGGIIFRKNDVLQQQTLRPCKIGTIEAQEMVDSFQYQTVDGVCMLESSGHKLWYGSPEVMGLLAFLGAEEESQKLLLESSEIQQGLIIPQGRITRSNSLQIGVFILNEAEKEALQLSKGESAWLRPYYGPKGFKAFDGFSMPSQWLIYGDACFIQAVQTQPHQTKRIKNHLDLFHALNTSDHAPYGLHRPRQPVWFESPDKILCLRQVSTPSFAWIPEPAYVNESFYVIRSRKYQDMPCFLVGVLNSDLAWFWLYHQKRKGYRLQVDKDVLRNFPDSHLPEAIKITYRDNIQQLCSRLTVSRRNRPGEELLNQLNAAVYQYYGLTGSDIETIRQWKKNHGLKRGL